MGQELNGSLESWVTLNDPFPALRWIIEPIDSHKQNLTRLHENLPFLQYLRCNTFCSSGGHSGLVGGTAPLGYGPGEQNKVALHTIKPCKWNHRN